MLRRLSLLFLLLSAAFAAVPAVGQEPGPGPVVVTDVRGPLDQRAIDFLVDVIRNEDAQLIVLKIDNPGVASGDLGVLVTAIQTSATPVAAWIGPEGAVAFGEVTVILDEVAIVGGAPGASYGLSAFEGHTDCGGTPEECFTFSGLYDREVTIVPEQNSDEFVVQPTIGQFIAALDGRDVQTLLGNVGLETAEEITLEDGTTATVSSVDVRFLKPTLLTRFLRLGTQPDGAFFFLMAGLAVVAFEFYAAGAGIAAAVAALSLFLAGYGFATLPMNWWAVIAAVLGIGLYTWDFQRHELGVRSIVGTVLILWGGIAFVGGPPQIGTSLWSVVLTAIGIALFYLFAMTTIVRSRFGTPTIGREHLVGATGVADSALDPDGVVVIDGAKWRARSHRAAGIAAGAEIEVLAVEGITLQVAPHEVAKT
ncbi:MAG: NfeD family protein [Acidimicrobiia bacterium]|nr:NfeD family protein [Acidimicrobiia bacterium]